MNVNSVSQKFEVVGPWQVTATPKDGKSFFGAFAESILTWDDCLDLLDLGVKLGKLVLEQMPLQETLRGGIKKIQELVHILELFSTREIVEKSFQALRQDGLGRDSFRKAFHAVSIGASLVGTVAGYAGGVSVETLNLLNRVADVSGALKIGFLAWGRSDQISLLSAVQGGALDGEVTETKRLRMMQVTKNVLTLSIFFFRMGALASGTSLVAEGTLLALSYVGALLGCSAALYERMQNHAPVVVVPSAQRNVPVVKEGQFLPNISPQRSAASAGA